MPSVIIAVASAGYLAGLVVAGDMPWPIRALCALAAVANGLLARELLRPLRIATARAVQVDRLAGPIFDHLRLGRDVYAFFSHHPDRRPGTINVDLYIRAITAAPTGGRDE